MVTIIRKLSAFNVFGAALIIAFTQGCATTAPEMAANHVGDSAVTESAPQIQKVADRRFSTDTLYALLVAEMAIDRKRYDIALGNYIQQAASTNDPGVAARATQLARVLNSHQSALEMAELWVELEPYNIDAHSVVTAELIEADRLSEAFEHSKELLEDGRVTAFESIAANAADDDISVTHDLLGKFESLLRKHPKNVELLVGYSMLLEQDNRPEEALKVTQKAMAVDPGNITAAFQESRLLQQQGSEAEAVQKLADLVERHPTNGALRSRYARILASTDLAESRRQFEILLDQTPYDPDVIFTLGLVERESGLLDDAARRFKVLLEQGQHLSSSNYQLGRIYEEKDLAENALVHYKEVEPGDFYLSAMTQAANILIGSENEYAALQMIRNERKSVSGKFKAGLYMLESNVLSNSGQMSAAEVPLSEGLREFPDNTALLYARAMHYTQIDYLSAAETDLKAILVSDPNNAAALNALGYTLADRTDRIDEAYDYIERALELTPDDPAVLDSMGWVEYRRGNNERALALLQRAMEAMPDHEVAAHYGEVLWVTGNEAEAIEVWKKGLVNRPDSQIIHKTIHRLNASID